MYDFKIKASVSEESMREAMTVWIESYWYDGYFRLHEVCRDENWWVYNVKATLDDDGDDLDRELFELDPATFARGTRLALDPNTLINHQLQNDIWRFVSEDNAGYLDAESADAIAQLGVFGSIVYG